MKIKATNKLLNIAGIKGLKDTSPSSFELPGEWYASLVSMNIPGKSAIHFLHYPTLITIIIPGKSLNKVLLSLPEKVSSLLKRHGYSDLVPDFQMNTSPEIFSTNNRSILGYMNDLKYNIEYHFEISKFLDKVDFEKIEDIHYDYLFGGKSFKGKFVKPEQILTGFLIKKGSR
jgi:hypothetical protein